MAPAAVVTEPTGTQTMPFPTVAWGYYPDPATGAAQAGAELLVFTAAQVAAEGFDPDTTEAVYGAELSGTATATTVMDALADGDYEVFVAVTDTDDVVSEWGSSAFTVAVPLGGVSRPTVVVGGRLGCGTYRAFLQARGGGSLVGELQWQQLRFGRRLDEVSGALVSVGVAGLADQECCWALSQAQAWKHELAIYRDSELAWVGVIGRPRFGTDYVSLPARDLFQWFERRLLEHDRSFTNADLAAVARQYIEDALERDTSPNITAVVTPCGVRGNRLVLASARRRAADELRELFRSGLDFTMVGRTMVVGGSEVPTAPLPPLTNDGLDEPYLEPDGMQTGTEVHVVGGRRADSDEPYAGVAGGVSTELGLVQVVFSEPSIEDNASCQAAAQSRYDMVGTTPEYLGGNLTPTAPVTFPDLVPGARWPARVQLACRTAIGDWRLLGVDVSAALQGDTLSEQVAVTLVPLGTTE